MPDNNQTQQPKVFDFTKAVEEAKRDYPKRTADITFIDTSAPDFYQQLEEFAKKAGLNGRQIEHIISRAENHEAVASNYGGHKLMAIPVNRPPEKGQFPDNQYKSAYFCFQHELGHFVIPKAHGQDDNKREEDWRENAADFFAITRGIQAGVFDKKDIIDQATRRSMASLVAYADINHMTTMTLDSIVINPKNIDFVSLSKDDIVKVAASHASAFEFKGNALTRFSDMKFAGKRAYDQQLDTASAVMIRLNVLHDICRDAPANSQEFYLAARIMDKIMEKGGVAFGNDKIEIDTTGADWKKTQEAIAAKTGDRDIGAKKASELSSFTRPKDENQSFVSLVRNKIKPLKI